MKQQYVTRNKSTRMVLKILVAITYSEANEELIIVMTMRFCGNICIGKAHRTSYFPNL